MMQRCYNPKTGNFERYGGRGIRVCERWRTSFQAFLEDMGIRPHGMSIDRIDNGGDYEPGNCQWATPLEQQQNTRAVRLIEFDGKLKSLRAWAREIGADPSVLRRRLKRQPIKDAFSAPVCHRAGGKPWDHSRSACGFKGVYEAGTKFIARIRANGKQHWLGSFDTATEAAAAYNEAALRLHGLFAQLNQVTT